MSQRLLPPALIATLLLAAPAAPAQGPAQVRDAAELLHALDKLQVLGCVLYVAAHPDDENTAVLACLSKGRGLRTAYLSMTRGGGGQNLIGPERDDALAALRTQELLAARRLDGAEQFFTRAVDFGFSKSPEETLAVWGHQAVLADLVWTIRKLRPDVILTRFAPTQGGTHGHHTASAMLALEAFTAAADPARFPEQLAQVRPWQARRIAWNAYRPGAEPAPGKGPFLDVGRYDPLFGKSYAELAAESRSMHRSQGFGAVPARGGRLESFEILAGAPAKEDLLEGVELGWGRVPGGEPVGALLRQARQAFRPERPEAVLPLLLKAKAALDQLGPDPWVEQKGSELVEAIRCAAGIWVEAIADRAMVAAGDPVAITATVLARGELAEQPVTLVSVSLAGEVRPRNQLLPANRPVAETFRMPLPALPISQPSWLQGSASPGLHTDGPVAQAGLAVDPPALQARFRLTLSGVPFELTVPVLNRQRDPVLGERYRPLAVAPAVLVDLAEPVQVLGDGEPRRLALTVTAGRAGVKGRVRLQAPPGWRLEPAELPFELAKAGDQVALATRLLPPAAAQSGSLRALVELDGRIEPARGLLRIDHPHIPVVTLFPPATARVVRLDLKRAGRRIGYLDGAGDQVAESLRPLGYQVEPISDEALAGADLSGFDAIIVGIRAFNTRPRLAQLNQRLLDYVAAGGTEIVQYSVDQELVTTAIGPYPFRISRTRVAEEEAKVEFLAPEHPALNWPNRITQADFAGWVQERGLQFAEGWDPRYSAILSTHDAGEKPSGGGLIVATHGKGRFVYTGLSFFRQLPAGVPGAYRLFANLLALGRPHD